LIDFSDYHRTQEYGYRHPVTGEFVEVDDMKPEIIVPASMESNDVRMPVVD